MLISVERVQEFCKAVEKVNSDAKFIYFSNEDGVSLYSEGQLATVYNLAKPSVSSFNMGIEAKPFLSLAKKLYPGDLSITFQSNNVVMKKDNIDAKFPSVAGKARLQVNYGTSLTQESSVKWVTEHLCKTTIAVDDAKHNKQFLGVLLETKDGITRLCKFSSLSLYLSSTEQILAENSRHIIPDNVIKIAKSFSKEILEYNFAERCEIVKLKNGTEVMCSKVHDTYMLEYLPYLGLVENINMLPESAEKYAFDNLHLANSIELVSAAMGDAESWVKFSVVGRSGEKIVWEISGKSQNGVEISEKLLSSGIRETDTFSINDKRTLKSLTCFGESVNFTNLSGSTIALSNEKCDVVILLTKVSV